MSSLSGAVLEIGDGVEGDEERVQVRKLVRWERQRFHTVTGSYFEEKLGEIRARVLSALGTRTFHVR
jgi:hypothetical protein